MDEIERRVNNPSDRYDISWNQISCFYNRNNARYKKSKNRGEITGQ